MAAPNISRSIKELEADLGIRVFERSSKGMSLTSEGETSDFKDMLIYKDGYTLSELDCRFVTELCSARRRSFGENNGYVAR